VSRVAVIFTGGTISMQADPVAGGNVPTLDGAAILARTPGLSGVADLVPIDRGLTPASHFTFADLFGLMEAVANALADPSIDGAVVVQGTDTIEETSFFLDLLLDGPKPVVVTGAMRTASESGYDGPANLRDAVRCAASPALRAQGVVVVLAGTIDAADDVTKTHASSLETFRSLNFGPLGRVERDVVIVHRRRAGRRHVAASRAAERVHLIKAHVGMDGSLLDAAVAAGADGLVVEATGAGNTSALLLHAAARAMATGVPVVLTTRSPAGRASTAYAFPGGGATWARAGAILAGYLGGPKARIALALGIGAGLDRDGLAALFADPGEAMAGADA
jgi:L-asparaginase